MFRKLIIPVLITAAMATSARAAFLTDIKGAVLVNGQPVAKTLQVAQGDRIKVVNGSASLVYSSGATVRVASGQTLAVLATPPKRELMTDESSQPQDGYEGGLVVAGGVGLAIVLSQVGKPASP
ncbi:MAG: hypothetical protein ACLPX9_05050 [Rhodomicrobium sp.]